MRKMRHSHWFSRDIGPDLAPRVPMAGCRRIAPMPDAFHQLEETVTADVTRALQEDVGTGDLTARLVPESRAAQARLMTRQDGVLCGVEWFDRTFDELDPEVEIFWHHKDGDEIVAGSSICELEGHAR